MTHQIHLHYFGFTDNGNRSDKVYILEISRHNERYWSVSAAWGRRGGRLSSQNKGMYASHWAAVAAFNALAAEKIAKGYKVTNKAGDFIGERAASL
jgi:predicted DNA-binding WGR domain protein